MKRISLITALALLLVAASATPAAAPKLDFSANVRSDRSVSLFVTDEACRLRPCSYTWDIDGVRAGSSRSLVVTPAPGCHEVVLRMTERRFRNPQPLDLSASQSVCVAAREREPEPAPTDATAAPEVTSTGTMSSPDTTAAPKGA